MGHEIVSQIEQCTPEVLHAPIWVLLIGMLVGCAGLFLDGLGCPRSSSYNNVASKIGRTQGRILASRFYMRARERVRHRAAAKQRYFTRALD